MLSREGKGARKARVPLKIRRQGRQEGRAVVLWGRDFGGSGKSKSRAFGVSSPGIFEEQQRASMAVADGEVVGRQER